MQKPLRYAAAILWCLNFAAPAFAHEHPATPRQELAASATVDANDVLWIATAKAGRVWVQRTQTGLADLSAPVPIGDVPYKVTAQGENRPKIAISKNGVVLVSYTTADTAPYAGHVNFTRSTDGGRSFSPPIRLNDDPRNISHRFESLIIEANGRVRVVWIDRRDVEDGKRRNGASLYTVWSDDDGATWSANQRLSETSCECCRLSLANDPAGHAWVLWRNIFSTKLRDHAVMPLSGGTPQRATFSGWQLDACPHQGPALAIDREDVRHLVWFAGNAPRGLFYSRLWANGEPLGNPHPLTPDGAYPAITTHQNNVLIAWLRFDGEAHRLEFTRSRDGGQTWQPTTTLARTPGAADYPQWLLRENHPQLFWRTANDGFHLLNPILD